MVALSHVRCLCRQGRSRCPATPARDRELHGRARARALRARRPLAAGDRGGAGGFRRRLLQRPPRSVVERNDRSHELRQRVGVARRGGARDAPRRARNRSDRNRLPLQPGRRRAADRHTRAPRTGASIPRRGIRGGDERGARRNDVAFDRGAARPDRGSAHDHHSSARRRNGRFPRPLLPGEARRSLLSTAPTAAGAHVGVPRGLRRRSRAVSPTASGRWAIRSGRRR